MWQEGGGSGHNPLKGNTFTLAFTYAIANLRIISLGCPRPSMALQVQNRGLKHHSFVKNPLVDSGDETIRISILLDLGCS